MLLLLLLFPLMLPVAASLAWAVGRLWGWVCVWLGGQRQAREWRQQQADAAARGAAAQEAWEREHEEFLRWAEAEFGGGAGTVDERLVTAQKHSRFVRRLLAHDIPNAVGTCLGAHWLEARTSGDDLFAFEDHCSELRSEVWFLLSHTVELLRHYPLKSRSPALLQNYIALRNQALPSCASCPFVNAPAAAVPLVCPTATILHVENIYATQPCA
jgi:hypothetical protein